MSVRCGVLNLRSLPPAPSAAGASSPSPACRLHGLLLLTAGFFCVRSQSPSQMAGSMPAPCSRCRIIACVRAVPLPAPASPFPLPIEKNLPRRREKDAVSAEQPHEGGRHAAQTAPRAAAAMLPLLRPPGQPSLLCPGERSPGKISPGVKKTPTSSGTPGCPPSRRRIMRTSL